jgi:hypothetical protein
MREAFERMKMSTTPVGEWITKENAKWAGLKPCYLAQPLSSRRQDQWLDLSAKPGCLA